MKINSKSNKTALLARLAELGRTEKFEHCTNAELFAEIQTSEARAAAANDAPKFKATRAEAKAAADHRTEVAAEENRTARLASAKVEKKALDTWAKNGRKGKKPSTPNLDALAEPAKKPAKTKAAKPAITWTREGKPVNRRRYTLGFMAYECTKDIKPGVARLSTEEFRKLLAKAGVTDPHSTWEVTLPNGVTVGAIAE